MDGIRKISRNKISLSAQLLGMAVPFVLIVALVAVAGCSSAPTTALSPALRHESAGNQAVPPDSAEPTTANAASRERVEHSGTAPYTVRMSPARQQPEANQATAFSQAFIGRVARYFTPLPASNNEYDVVSVLWGTDRELEGGAQAEAAVAARQPLLASLVPPSARPEPPPLRLGATRSTELSVGSADVTIPRSARQRGTIARPRRYTILNVDFYRESENPAKHFTILNLEKLGRETFAAKSNAILAGSQRYKDQVLVFVHGYNTSFEEALYRTAQIAHDIEFDGLPAMYSWPSRATSLDYSYDLNSAVRAQSYFIEFLNRLAITTRADRIHLIAHSLGNRAMLEALRALQRNGNYAVKSKIGQIVFAAPDVDRDLFVEIASGLRIGAGRTLYASASDKALILSRQLDGVPRAGDVPRSGPVVVKGVDTIDISAAGSRSILAANHNLYADRPRILDDLKSLLSTGRRPPDTRYPGFKAAVGTGGRYWKLAAE